MKSALVLVDIQNDYFKGGKFELVNSENAAKNARQILDYYRLNKLPVFYIQHINKTENAPFFVKDTVGAEIYGLIKPNDGEKVIIKGDPNSFYNTSLNDELKRLGVNHLVICGMMTHMCIDTTVRAAKDLEYTITLIHDACATRDLMWDNTAIPAETVHTVFMSSMNWVFAEVISADMFLEKFR